MRIFELADVILLLRSEVKQELASEICTGR